jgi:crotonobetainyl-CoA:carnitine CoA-transferase CaiB-like acyl-CoA transferase
VAIATVEDSSFVAMCEALSLDELLADPRFASTEGRVQHVDALTQAITRVISKMTTDDVVQRLLDVTVACGPVLGIGELIEDAHIRSRGALLSISPWGDGALPVPALPFKMDGCRWAAEERGPELGSCTLERLEKELLEHR